MMKRLYFLGTALFFVLLSIKAQVTYFSCDFNQGIPDNFTLYEKDQREPSVDMKALGFSIGVPWIATTTDSDSNYAACSTSWYKNAGKSDDWMILPSVFVQSEEAILSWRAKAGDNSYRDGYAIYISDKGSAIDDFNMDDAFYNIRAEQSEWVFYSMNLKDYIGKTIYIAFVNNSTDKATLFVDDIFVGVPSAVELALDLPRITNEIGDLEITGTAKATLGRVINGFEIEFTYDGNVFSQSFTDVIQPGESVNFKMKNTLPILRIQTIKYNASVKNENDRYFINGAISAYQKKVVAVEVTGIGCGYCVRGIVAIEEMKEYYPETFMGSSIP